MTTSAMKKKLGLNAMVLLERGSPMKRKLNTENTTFGCINLIWRHHDNLSAL